MKKILLFVLLALVGITNADAKRRETAEEIERKTRHYSGWEWGAAGRANLVFYELDYMRVANESPVSAYKAHAKFGGNIMLNGGYYINNHWKVGVELGAQIQYDYTSVPIYATAHYFYGTRKNCLFNFLNLGTNILFDKGLRFGATGAGGVGFRIQTPDSHCKYDIMLGYQALMLNPRPVVKEPFNYSPKDINRKRLDQCVFIGLGVSF
jgi:hypothetical protein